jgi:hypothetical protein
VLDLELDAGMRDGKVALKTAIFRLVPGQPQHNSLASSSSSFSSSIFFGGWETRRLATAFTVFLSGKSALNINVQRSRTTKTTRTIVGTIARADRCPPPKFSHFPAIICGICAICGLSLIVGFLGIIAQVCLL